SKILPLCLENPCVVPVLAEDHDPGLEALQLRYGRFSESGESVLDPAETLVETLIHAVGLPPAHGDEEDDDSRAEELAGDHVELIVLVVERGPAAVMARRVLGAVQELRVEKPTPVAFSCADIAFAGVNLQLRDVEQGHALLFLLQVLLKSQRELC